MGKCVNCGRKGLFLFTTSEGLCRDCDAKLLKEAIVSHIVSNVEFTIEHSFSVTEVEVRQKTEGALQPFSADAWSGYVSPSGGFVNFARYRVTGINPATNRKNKRIYEESSEEFAILKARIAGLVDPFEVELLPSEAPTERQLDYAKDLGIVIPDGACRVDVSALISRVTDEDESPADEDLAFHAYAHGIKFSRYHGKVAIMSLARELPSDEYKEFISLL